MPERSRKPPPKYWYLAAFWGVLSLLDIAWGLAIHHLPILIVGVVFAGLSVGEWFRARKEA